MPFFLKKLIYRNGCVVVFLSCFFLVAFPFWLAGVDISNLSSIHSYKDRYVLGKFLPTNLYVFTMHLVIKNQLVVLIIHLLQSFKWFGGNLSEFTPTIRGSIRNLELADAVFLCCLFSFSMNAS